MNEESDKQINFKNVKAHIGSIKLSGVSRTSQAYIENQFQDIFKATNFEDLVIETEALRTRLGALGCFKDVEALIDKSASKRPNTYDILINIDEVGPISGGVHTSIGNNDGSVNTNVCLTNLFGKSERLGCEYGYGTNSHIDYRLFYSSPIEMDPTKRLSVSGFRSSNDFPWSKYRQNENGIQVEYKSPYSWIMNDHVIKGSHSISYEGVWRELVSSLDSAFSVREQSGHSLKSSIKYTNEIDKRDNKVLPTEGAYMKSNCELAGLGGDVKFFKFNSDYQISKTFFKYFTTQFTFSKGLVLPLGHEKKVSIADNFFLGGPLTMRGFTNRGAGFQKDECALGNTGFWLAGLHLYTPLPFLHKQETLNSWLKTHTFINAGNIMACDGRNSISKENLFENSKLSIGSGLVIAFGQMARLELNYVYPLWKHQRDKSVSGIQFGIGLFFN